MTRQRPEGSSDPTDPAAIPDPAALPLFAAPDDRGQVESIDRARSRLSSHPDRIRSGENPFVSPRRRGATAHADIDWALVAAFRKQASDKLLTALGDERVGLDEQSRRELGRTIILELLEDSAQNAVADGDNAWTLDEQQRLAEAIYNALFGLGRLQPIVDDDEIENVEIYGCDDVTLEYADGSLRDGPPVADSDEELLEFLTFLASRSEGNARPFSEAQPRLHMRLDGGARLAAVAWNTTRPAVVIRRHRLQQIDLSQLRDTGTLSDLQVTFLRAAVKAKKSIVVAGDQGAGKTTLVRALCAEFDPYERIGTFETEYELHLHKLGDKHRRIVPFEARPGSGEIGPDGRPAGEVTIDQLLYDSFRFNLSRQIVGEVRGKEVIAMIKAMQSGTGSISTTHAGSASGAIRKLITCAMEAGAHVTPEYATRAIAEHIDLVVYVNLETGNAQDGQAKRKRWVSEIVAVEPGEKEVGYAITHVFRPSPGGPGTAAVLPDHLRDLEAFGFDARAFEIESRGRAS
ncbi:CpaF family protein [Flexivirga caeni]|uniref:CpaF family protein n=1 Tax=Flexivirga caeni TaxID=2294115 RepID=A0A3M9MJD9_9MICO|nr:CpaF/VirB11 family protein [Flexivirga caeni]RNI24778.1 CpaF family protein [Flexivirga caeni]